MAEFLTIRKTAAKKFASERFIRQLVASGQCPGIRVGNRFMVNVTALEEQLDQQSRMVKGGEAG